MTPNEWLAIKAIGTHAAKFRGEAEPGKEQDVDMLVRIQGSIDIGNDGTTTRRSKPSAEVILGIIVQELMESEEESDHDTANQLLTRMAELADANEGALPEPLEGYKARAVDAIRRVSPVVNGSKKGAVRANIRIGQVSMEGLSRSVSTAVNESTRAILLEEQEA